MDLLNFFLEHRKTTTDAVLKLKQYSEENPMTDEERAKLINDIKETMRKYCIE